MRTTSVIAMLLTVLLASCFQPVADPPCREGSHEHEIKVLRNDVPTIASGVLRTRMRIEARDTQTGEREVIYVTYFGDRHHIPAAGEICRVVTKCEDMESMSADTSKPPSTIAVSMRCGANHVYTNGDEPWATGVPWN